MRDSLDVAVIIPAFNSEDTIRRALDSVVAQTRLPSAIIVIDDFSNDKTIEKISEFIAESKAVPVTLIRNTSNIGPGCSRNSDDAWMPKKIEIQLEVLENHPEIDLLCSETQLFGTPIVNQQNANLNKLRSITLNQLLFKNLIPTRTVILRRSIPYRFEKGLSEDYGLWLKCLDNGLVVRRLPFPLALHFRPEFSPGGLSAKLLIHEFYELKNLFQHIRTKPIVVICAIIFSLVKFLRRIMIKLVRKVKN